MTGSHPTLQLPAVVTVMNLDNGREVTVRLNDRGPKEIGRLLGLSRKAADLLGMGTAPARVRIVEDEAASRHLAEILPGGPMLQINAAPLETVTQTQLKEAKAGARVGRAVPAVQQSAPQEATVADGPIVLSDLLLRPVTLPPERRPIRERLLSLHLPSREKCGLSVTDRLRL
ncbi:septal ring lytic transglycosylase RlpA family protein [Acetobacter senegalensis]|nr:RlpA-like double-psi beta-barrel domain-containing protein [Acetobacter senegalensis]